MSVEHSTVYECAARSCSDHVLDGGEGDLPGGRQIRSSLDDDILSGDIGDDCLIRRRPPLAGADKRPK